MNKLHLLLLLAIALCAGCRTAQHHYAEGYMNALGYDPATGRTTKP